MDDVTNYLQIHEEAEEKSCSTDPMVLTINIEL